MSKNGPAKLTGDLLVKKGYATPTGYSLSPRMARQLVEFEDDEPGTIHGKTVKREQGDYRWPEHHTDAYSQSGQASKSGGRPKVIWYPSPDQHLRLKLASVHMHCSMRDLVGVAVDCYLDQVSPSVLNGNCLCIGTKSKRGGDG